MRLTPLLLVCLIFSSLAWGKNKPSVLTLSTPSSPLRVVFSVGKWGEKLGVPMYQVFFGKQELLQPSRLGLRLKDSDLSSDFKIFRTQKSDGVDAYRLPLGKTAQVRDAYTQYIIELKNLSTPAQTMTLTFRLYREGIAFCYSISEKQNHESLEIIGEDSEFVPSKNPQLYALPLGFASSYEGHYKVGSVSDFNGDKPLALPVLLRYSDTYLMITEANLHHYANAYLSATQEGPAHLSLIVPSTAHVKGAFQSPWRVMIAGRSLKPLIQSNLITSLSAPALTADTSWIKPGKILFQWWNGYTLPGRNYKTPSDVLNGETLKGYIDFCAKYGIPYISLDGYEFDKAWYGGKVLSFDPKSQDITHPAPEMTLFDVLKYAKSKGVLVRVWMHEEGLTHDNMEHVLTTYKSWGISGIMVDFMGDDTQKGVERIEEILRRALAHQLTVSFHGIAKPTGLTRTYPNLLTEESVMGQEYNKWPGPNSTPEHEIYTGMIRGAVGPMDTHQGSFRPVPQSQFVARSLQPYSMGTLAHQIATYVVYENELPMLADYPQAYERHEDVFRFLLQVPATWDETQVLMADLDRQLLTIARRSGKDWFVGSLSGSRSAKYSVPLSFLNGKDWQAEAYSDTPDSDHNGESIARTVFQVHPEGPLWIKLSAGGGQLIRFKNLKPDLQGEGRK